MMITVSAASATTMMLTYYRGTAGATTYTTQWILMVVRLQLTAAYMLANYYWSYVTISADMYDEDDQLLTTTGGLKLISGDNRSVSVSLDAPIGDATIGLDDYW